MIKIYSSGESVTEVDTEDWEAYYVKTTIRERNTGEENIGKVYVLNLNDNVYACVSVDPDQVESDLTFETLSEPSLKIDSESIDEKLKEAGRRLEENPRDIETLPEYVEEHI